jgi:hypothetical protein
MSEAKQYPLDPMGDDARASIVTELIDWWEQSPDPAIQRIPAETRRQMAMAAGAFARNALGEIAELKRMVEAAGTAATSSVIDTAVNDQMRDLGDQVKDLAHKLEDQ